MGLIDDIKNIQPISNEVITNEKFNKMINDFIKDVNKKHKLLHTFKQVDTTKVHKQIGVVKYEFIGFDLGNDVDKNRY